MRPMYRQRHQAHRRPAPAPGILRVAIDAWRPGRPAASSPGNTGAILALRRCDPPMPGISRPAMAPSARPRAADVVLLDLGANIACDSRNLVEFAVMGDVFARTVLGLTRRRSG